MAELRSALLELLNQSPLRELSGDLLRSVPGLPPVLQTVHLLGAAVLMGTAVMLSLRLLSLVAHNQDPAEMSRRLFPWFFCALPVMLLSALPFFLARPQRYLSNPVFDIKMISLAVAIIFSILLWRAGKQLSQTGITWSVRGIALFVIAGWILTLLAGRWIAYADYIFWSE